MGSGWKGPVSTVVVRHFGNCGCCGDGGGCDGGWYSGRDGVYGRSGVMVVRINKAVVNVK